MTVDWQEEHPHPSDKKLYIFLNGGIFLFYNCP